MNLREAWPGAHPSLQAVPRVLRRTAVITAGCARRHHAIQAPTVERRVAGAVRHRPSKRPGASTWRKTWWTLTAESTAEVAATGTPCASSPADSDGRLGQPADSADSDIRGDVVVAAVVAAKAETAAAATGDDVQTQPARLSAAAKAGQLRLQRRLRAAAKPGQHVQDTAGCGAVRRPWNDPGGGGMARPGRARVGMRRMATRLHAIESPAAGSRAGGPGARVTALPEGTRT